MESHSNLMSLVWSWNILYIGSYSTEQFTESQSVLSIRRMMKNMILSEVLRCSGFILYPRPFTLLLMLFFHRLPMSQTKGREGGGLRKRAKCSFLCAIPSHFFSALPQMDPSHEWETSSQLFNKETSFMCVWLRLGTCTFIFKTNRRICSGST